MSSSSSRSHHASANAARSPTAKTIMARAPRCGCLHSDAGVAMRVLLTSPAQSAGIRHQLRLDPVDRARERNCLPHVLEAANPAHHPLDSHAEAAVRHAAEAAQIEVPLDRFGRELVLLDALHQQAQVVDALAAADDLAI